MNGFFKDNSYCETLAIVGGGMMGIAAALELAKSGKFLITLFEKNETLGGLSSYFQWQELIWDRFYHVVLSTDTEMLKFIGELDLQDKLFWRDTKSGFYGEGKLVSFSSSLDFLKFPFMSPWQKFRMGLGILYCSSIKEPSRLEKIYIRQWLTKVFGRRVYENIWEPLLRSKLGGAKERTSAAFIWATINRLYGARSSGTKQEKMGHVRGGYYSILKSAEEKLIKLGVKVLTNSPVLKLELLNNSYNRPINLTTKNETIKFDKVLITVDCPTVLKMISSNNHHQYWEQLKKVEYLGVICVLLILSRRLSPYYVINLLDRDLPFTGIIEATNVACPEDLGGKYLVYLPKYLTSDDPLVSTEDDKIIENFIEKLKKVYPDLKDEEILHKRLFRATRVQPLQEPNFSERTLEIPTPVKGVYLVNTSMICNSTINNNAAITLAHKAVNTIINGK
jgi:protoporphyrinogen oxidase